MMMMMVMTKAYKHLAAKEASLVLAGLGEGWNVEAIEAFLDEKEWPLMSMYRAWQDGKSLGEGTIATVKRVKIGGRRYAMKVSSAG
jgi:hypothetical protein